MNTFRNLYVLIGLVLITPSAFGLGLGELTLESYVNEPLKARVQLLDVGGLQSEDIRIRLATQGDFDRLGVERAYFLTNIRFEVVLDSEGARIHLATEEPLVEPYLDFLIEARWPAGRLLREYTVLVDLPPSGAMTQPLVQEQASAVEIEAPGDNPSVSIQEAPESPVRQYDQGAKPSPAPGGKYLVTSDDTLWKIASKAAPTGASIEQTMLATVAMNPKAFTRGNINGLKAGYVLTLPADSDVSLGVADAIAMVRSQNNDWRAGVSSEPVMRVVADTDLYGEGVAEAVDDRSFDTGASMLASSSDGTAAGDQQPASEGQGVAALAGQDATSSADADPQQVGVQDNSQTSLALVEAELADLSGQIGNLRELVTIKDRQIAELQALVAAQQEVGSSDNLPPRLNWLLPLVAGSILGAVALFLGLKLRDRRTAATPLVAGESVEAPLTPVPEVSSLTPKADSSAPSASAADGAITEALAEAEVYVSYGRPQQALNILAAAAGKSAGAMAAEAYCKMVEIAVDNDRREEALQWLDEIKATGSEEQIARATDTINASESHSPDLGELVEIAEHPGSQQREDQSPIADALGVGVDTAADSGLMTGAAGETAVDHQVAPSAESDSLELAADSSAASTDVDIDSLELDDLDANKIEPAAEAQTLLPPELAEVLGTDLAPLHDGADTETEPEGLIYAAEVDPMEAKLDLARAYIDMGDGDGARPILEEVVTDGDLRQQAEARELLIHID